MSNVEAIFDLVAPLFILALMLGAIYYMAITVGEQVIEFRTHCAELGGISVNQYNEDVCYKNGLLVDSISNFQATRKSK